MEALRREIDEQISILAYSLKEKLSNHGLRNVPVRGFAGSGWGVAVSPDNPSDTLPNILIYPGSILDMDREEANAELRHRIGQLNHPSVEEMRKLKTYCEEHSLPYRAVSAIAESLFAASADYLEIKDSICSSPGLIFRPRYRRLLNMQQMTDMIIWKKPFAQLVDLTLIEGLELCGILPSFAGERAFSDSMPQVQDVFTDDIRMAIRRAVASSVPGTKTAVVTDILWPAFSKTIPADTITPQYSEEGDDRSEVLKELGNDPEARDNKNCDRGGLSPSPELIKDFENSADCSTDTDNSEACDNDNGSDSRNADSDDLSSDDTAPSYALDRTGTEEEIEFVQGGKDNSRSVRELFEELEILHEFNKDPFSRPDGYGNDADTDGLRALSYPVVNAVDYVSEEENERQRAALENLSEIKNEQEQSLMNFFREEYNLDGKALSRYIELRTESAALTNDLTDFFNEKFNLLSEFTYSRNHTSGSCLQKGWTDKYLGLRNGYIPSNGTNTVILPDLFLKRSRPEKPEILWSMIIDNSASCKGRIIEQEKAAAVAMVEAAGILDIPFEILVFGSENGFVFLKTFDSELKGEELSHLVMLDADKGTPDVLTLKAACESIMSYENSHGKSCNFIYFMTDGQSGGGSVKDVREQYSREIVITGIGLSDAGKTIKTTWGPNAVSVPDVARLSDALLNCIQEQIEETFG